MVALTLFSIDIIIATLDQQAHKSNRRKLTEWLNHAFDIIKLKFQRLPLREIYHKFSTTCTKIKLDTADIPELHTDETGKDIVALLTRWDLFQKIKLDIFSPRSNGTISVETISQC
jgi:hypothetical protein